MTERAVHAALGVNEPRSLSKGWAGDFRLGRMGSSSGKATAWTSYVKCSRESSIG